MSDDNHFDIFLVAPPGLEAVLLDETLAAGFAGARQVPGGVEFLGGWPDVWRANLTLRGATRVLARIGAFRAMHLAQLDKRAHKFPWSDVLRPDVPVRVETTARKSRIYHAGAATQRIERAITDTLGAPISADAPVTIKMRIEDDLCTISVDTSGESLHKRGHKSAVGKAPMRETLAALFLQQCGFDWQEPVVDPMCGSGTFVIEAAEIAAGLLPGRSRSFAFELLSSFDPKVWARMRGTAAPAITPPATPIYLGSDRNTGAIQMSRDNAARAGVSALTQFTHHAISDLPRPDLPPGLVIVNPPYGARIGNRKLLFPLYGALGKTLMERFAGWRVGVITSEPGLARATGLPFGPDNAPVPHGGLSIRLFLTGPLPG
ncbi:THUMP domain-containing class I SAM-dependent RNA methyltransferase [Paracoccus pacificus]|uniref:Class I SAM-dependent RNA methyltransferase n=1 Tax=Paracoccus pacificus TaxID=1463598 RepID=A0ABW4RAN7_9RHOB